ncbi:MAG: glycosyltransferase family 4 protein [Salinivirgaceae bacterium]
MESGKTKLFVSAYACEPGLGSEIGVGWHWVLELSKYFDLWVLTRKSNQNSIELWLKKQVLPGNVTFVYFDLPKKLRFWKKGLRGVRLYYILWQKLSNKLVKKTMQEQGIRIYHLLTYGNALWPASKYGQQQLFIWGPTGVGDVIPFSFYRHYPLKGQLTELLRTLIKQSLPLNRGFYKRCKNAKLILCKTEASYRSIPQRYREKALIFTDVAVSSQLSLKAQTNPVNKSTYINYLAVGRLDAWRGFDVLIEAFALAVKENPFIRLELLGKGSDKSRLQQLIRSKNMEAFIQLSGQVTMDEYYTKLLQCDVVVNPALKEGAVTVAFDSMAAGKPLICVETGGYTHYFTNDYACVIPLTNRKRVIDEMAAALLLLSDEKKRSTMGQLAKKQAEQFSWQKKGEDIYKLICDTL